MVISNPDGRLTVCIDSRIDEKSLYNMVTNWSISTYPTLNQTPWPIPLTTEWASLLCMCGWVGRGLKEGGKMYVLPTSNVILSSSLPGTILGILSIWNILSLCRDMVKISITKVRFTGDTVSWSSLCSEPFYSVLESNALQGASTQVPQTASASPLLELLYSVVDPVAEIRHSASHPSRWRPGYMNSPYFFHQFQKG